MYCRNCGKEIKEDASFCPYCGASVDNNGTGSNNWQQTNSNIQTEAPDYTYQSASNGQAPKNNHRGPFIAGCIAAVAAVLVVVGLIASYQEEQEAEERSKLSEINVIEVQRAVNIVDDFLSGDKLATTAWVEMVGVLESIEEAETEESVEITNNVKACINTICNELEQCRVFEGLSGDKSVILENRNKIAEYAGLE